MRYRILYLLWCLLALARTSIASASEMADTLQQHLINYNLEKPHLGLYVHTDKNKYLVGDTVWFKAYTLYPYKNKVLYIRLTDPNKNIVLKNQFPMYDLGAHGELVIPDDLPEGKYYLYAFTDLMMSLSPGKAFVQPLTVGKNRLNRLEAEASVVSPKKIHRGDPVEISVNVNKIAGKTLKGVYSLSNEGTVFKEGRITANKLGYANIRFTYPVIGNDESVRCEFRFNDDKDVAELSLNLRHEGNTLQLHAYPEGGHLLEGVPGRLTIETQDEHNNPLKAAVGLLENGKEVCATESDTYGLGELLFTPKKGARYRLRITENDSTYQTELPCPIETEGLLLKARADRKTISTVVYNTGPTDSVNLIVRSINKMVWNQPYLLGKGDSVNVNIPAADLPDGLLNLAVFDTDSLPKSERLLNNPKGENYTMRLSMERAKINGNIEAKVSLHINDRNGKPVKANLSVSIVEKNSMNWADYHTIVQSERFKNLSVPFPYTESEKQVDKWLIGQNLGKYDWSHVQRYKPTGTIKLLYNPSGIIGRIQMKENKTLNMGELCLEYSTIPNLDKNADPVRLFSESNNTGEGKAVNRSRFTVQIIDSLELIHPFENGYFSIPASSLTVRKNQTKVLKLRGAYGDVESVEITDYPNDFDTMVRSGSLLDFPVPFNTVTKYKPTIEKSLTKSIQLREVSVEAWSKALIDKNMGKKEDYVCREFNVFNCGNHRVGGKKPEVGMVYSLIEKGTTFVYNGVGKRFTPAPEGATPGTRVYWPITNISSPNTFFQPAITDTTFLKTDLRNTVYWSPNLDTDESGNQQFNFCTSNRKGSFTIIVQGIDTQTRQAIFGRYEFIL